MYLFFGEVAVQIFYPFSLSCESSLIYSDYKCFMRHIFINIFPVMTDFFSFLTEFFKEQEFLILIKTNVSNLF